MRSEPTSRCKVSALAALVGIACVSGCANRVAVPPLKAEEVSMMKTAANFPQGEYRVEPGDTIEIRFPFHEDMNQRELVRPDGKISAKIAGEITVAGLQTTEIERLLKDRTSSQLRDPEVEVTVTDFAPKSVYVTGEVGRPGLIPYRQGLTPLQAVIDAGGFQETALVDYVILIRSSRTDDRFVSRALDLRAAAVKGAEEPLELAPHDVVYVPKTRIAEADLWVDQHVTRLFPFIRGTATSFPLGF